MNKDNSNNDFEWVCLKWLLIVFIILVCMIPAVKYYKRYRLEKQQRELREQDSIFWKNFYDKYRVIEEDSVEIAKRDSIRRINDSIWVVREKETEKKKAEERAAYEKEIRREADKFLRSYSGKSRGTYSSDSHSSDHHSNNDDDDDDDDTWYRDEDDADEQYEYDYWE